MSSIRNQIYLFLGKYSEFASFGRIVWWGTAGMLAM
jgi:hypothetical protein